MTTSPLVPLELTMRIEPGCLGPDGINKALPFCQFAEEPFHRLGGQALHWQIEPRFDKTLPEIEYRLQDKKLTQEQAERYLSLLELKLAEQEEQASALLSELVETFLAEQC
ncbi:hypothetical protein [Celerinatantimonas sp. YJH-8]|uniref:hypothetical protein n=1 Tax=Celerinatantimonas sp. YJH-8 TaxID=3228714 RepID=UPI0038BE47B0